MSAQSQQQLFQITSCSASPELSSSHQEDDKHIYTNIREMDELNSRPFPPVPDVADVPRRNLNNGWMEYETEAGRWVIWSKVWDQGAAVSVIAPVSERIFTTSRREEVSGSLRGLFEPRLKCRYEFKSCRHNYCISLRYFWIYDHYLCFDRVRV